MRRFKLSLFFSIVILILSLVFIPQQTFAHLAEGIDLHNGDYTIDIGYDPAVIKAQEPIFFLFGLGDNNKSAEIVQTTSAWVRIRNGNQSVFAATLYPEPTGTYTLVTTFPDQGNYELTVRFKTKEGVVENTTMISVVAQHDNMVLTHDKINHYNYYFVIGLLTIVIIVLLFIIFYFYNKNKKRNQNLFKS